jgi:ribosomal protein S1
MRKVLLSASLLGLLMYAGASARTQPIPTAPQGGQQSQQATKSMAGTVASIGDNGRSFALEVKDGSNKQTVQFVLDQNTQVQGTVKVGTPVTVQYVAMNDQNVAKSITAQG